MQSNNPQSRKTLIIVQAGLIAALYTVLTIICNAMGLASGVIQVRFSEALCILPCFTVAGVPGLFVGCLVSNLVTGGAVWDIVFGSLATLLGAVGTRLLRKNRWLASLPPIAANALIIPFVLRYAYGAEDAWWFMALTVGAGEIISAGLLGQLLYTGLSRRGVAKDIDRQ